MQTELAHQIAAMGLGCLHTYAQRGCYLFCTFPFRYELRDLSLAGREVA